MKLVTIMDNLPGEQKSMTAEHGLSFFVETNSAKLLFDFGAGAAAWENARKLNVRTEQIDFAIGSHGHYDHAAGYREFVSHGLSCPLLTGPGFFEEKYAYDGIKATCLGTGFDEQWLNEQGVEHWECTEVMEFTKGCYVVGNIQRTFAFETIPGRFVLRQGECWVQDFFRDEVCLVMDQKEGQVVILGCSHPGVLNILSTVQSHFRRPIKAVFGGTHLVEADGERIKKTIEIMRTMGIALIGFNHCSGSLFREMMKEERDLTTCYLGVGDCMYL